MKKTIATILSILMLSLMSVTCFGQGEHVVIDDYSKYLTEQDYVSLNDELEQIARDYDTDIYFVIADVDDSKLDQYASSFLEGSAANKVVLCVSAANTGYVLKASGSRASSIYYDEKNLWNAYNEASRYVEGIRAYYQRALQIIDPQKKDSYSSKQYVDDGAGLLSASQISALESKLKSMSGKYGCDVVLCTVNSLMGKSERNYADDYYDHNGYADDGILLLVDMDSAVIYLSTSGDCIDYFTDDGLEYILDLVEERMNEGDYYGAFNTYADQAADFIASGKNGNVIEPEQKKEKGFGLFNIGISGLVAALASLIGSGILKGQLKSVHSEKYAGKYLIDRSFVLTGSSDMLVDRRVSRTPIRRQEHSESHPKSTIHTSSSGRTHGGAGRHFKK